MSEDATIPAGREPVEQPPIKAVFHINNTQGIQVPESLFPEGKIPAPVVDDRHLETYRKFGVSEEVIKQVAERRPVSAEEVRLAQHAKNSFIADAKKVQAYLDGDVDLRRTMMTLNIILSSTIKDDEK